jgi:UDP-2-acetamido-3-amino-2,3-dideoxy-glucuronate N-acetyltransferase
METKIHPLSDVQSENIGNGTSIWQYCVILPESVIGQNCNINCQVFIENDVVIGDNVTVKPGVQVWDGLRIEDDVFIGPNVTFTNDFVPRSKQPPDEFARTTIQKGASIGANATILPGLTIGKYALIGAGSVVTKDVEPYTMWVGNPAQMKGYVTKDGTMVSLNYKDKNGNEYKFIGNEPVRRLEFK